MRRLRAEWTLSMTLFVRDSLSRTVSLCGSVPLFVIHCRSRCSESVVPVQFSKENRHLKWTWCLQKPCWLSPAGSRGDDIRQRTAACASSSSLCASIRFWRFYAYIWLRLGSSGISIPTLSTLLPNTAHTVAVSSTSAMTCVGEKWRKQIMHFLQHSWLLSHESEIRMQPNAAVWLTKHIIAASHVERMILFTYIAVYDSHDNFLRPLWVSPISALKNVLRKKKSMQAGQME